jgi:glutamate-1-semialdehyde 2,1-aminomutase
VATLGLPNSPGVPDALAALTLTVAFNDLDAVRELFAERGGDIAAVIVEPVVGNAGLILPDAGFLRGLREVTSAHGALLIFDEVMTGFRVAHGGAQALYGITPDLTCLGKVIGGGLPVAAYGGRREIMAQIAPAGPVYQAGTLSGNPLAMAAGIATLHALAAPGVYDSLRAQTAALVEIFNTTARRAGVPLAAGAVGSMWGFFFRDGAPENFAEAKQADTARYAHVFHALLDAGIYLAPSQFEAAFVSTAHDAGTLEQTARAVADAMRVA